MKRYKESEKQNIQHLLSNKQHLIPIFQSTLYIPERVHAYSDDLFLVYNAKSDRFELHSTENKGSTHSSTLPYKRLDERTMRYIWKYDLRVHGKAIFDRIERQEAVLEKKKEKEEKDFIRDFGKEFRSEFAKDAWIVG